MRLVCISAAHTPYDGALMEKSAQRVGVEIVRFKEGEPWPNDFRVGKLVHGLECIRQLPEDVTHVMFVDSSDTLFLAGPEKIVARFEDMRGQGTLAVVSGEKNCYPITELAPEFKYRPTPWHFVNSGSWIMRREDSERILTSVAGQADYCDQLCWSKAYLEIYSKNWSDVYIDVHCLLFQSMYLQVPTDFELKDGRLANLVTGGQPAVLHWNGTRNQGVPFSRDGVWCALDPSHTPETPKVPTIAVCMPGASFSNHWVFGFANLYLEMVKYFGNVRLVNSCGNNIYQVRENCIKMCAGDKDGPPDYILWIDSDNPPSPLAFAQLWAAITKNEGISCVGGWYRFYNALTNEVLIAAGRMDSSWENITETEIRESEHLIRVPFIGFGLCLMKWQMIADVGVNLAFKPYHFPEPDPKSDRTWATDDSGFFAQASLKGHKTFLHPAVFLEHEKQMNVPASFEMRNEIPVAILKES